jgi:hypothetical protein
MSPVPFLALVVQERKVAYSVEMWNNKIAILARKRDDKTHL